MSEDFANETVLKCAIDDRGALNVIFMMLEFLSLPFESDEEHDEVHKKFLSDYEVGPSREHDMRRIHKHELVNKLNISLKRCQHLASSPFEYLSPSETFCIN